MLKKYINLINTFDDVYTVSKSLKKKQKGDLFEELTKYIFKYHHVYKNITKEIWLFNELSDSQLKELNMPNKDKGIDLVMLDKYDKYHAIQCKFRLDIDQIIPWKEISTFYGLSFISGFTGGFYVTNTTNVSAVIKKSKNIIQVYGDFFNNIPKSFFDELKTVLLQNQSFKAQISLPRPHQLEAIQLLINHYKNNDRGYLSMICGSGKTLTSYWFDKEMKNNLTIVAVPSLYLLSQFYDNWSKQNVSEDCKINYILVGSDSDIAEIEYANNGLIITTNPDTIMSNIKSLKNEKIVIITTYQSSDKVIESLKKLQKIPNLCILDEAHKTVGQNNKQFNLLLSNKNLQIEKRMFMTATPKMYDGELDNEKILSMNDEKWYGKEIYSYSMSNAIKDNYLSKYELSTMFVDNQYIETTVGKNKYVSENKTTFESHHLATAIMLLNSFNENKCHHLITYHNSVASSCRFKVILENLNKIYKLQITILDISGNHTMSQRKKIINEFEKSNLSILVSAKVLNEGVDIPIIDSICFVDSRSSTVDIIQCIGRALRLHQKKNITKIFIPLIIDDLNNVDEKKTLGNIIRILKSLNETDENVGEYFTAIKNGNEINKKLINYTNYVSKEKISQEINIENWIKNIGVKLWNKNDTKKISNNSDETIAKPVISQSEQIYEEDTNDNTLECNYCGNTYLKESQMKKHMDKCSQIINDKIIIQYGKIEHINDEEDTVLRERMLDISQSYEIFKFITNNDTLKIQLGKYIDTIFFMNINILELGLLKIEFSNCNDKYITFLNAIRNMYTRKKTKPSEKNKKELYNFFIMNYNKKID